MSPLNQFQKDLIGNDSSCNQLAVNKEVFRLRSDFFSDILNNLAKVQNNSHVQLVLVQMMKVDLQHHRDTVESKQVIGSVGIVCCQRVLGEDVDQGLNIGSRKQFVMRVMFISSCFQ